MPRPLGHLADAGFAAIFLTSIAACGSGAASPTPAVSASTTTAPTAAAFETSNVDIGGRTLHLVCVGSASASLPTVMFEGGLGDDVRTWVYPMAQVAATTRACAYERAGNGESPAATGPRTTADQVDDLEHLMDAAGITGPVILVGWSVGGWNAMVYTGRHPERVAGLVLVDVRSPDLSARLLAELPAKAAGESEALAGNRDELTTFETDPTLNSEGLDLRASAAEAGAASYATVPVRFLWAGNTAAQWEGLDPQLASRLDAVGRGLRTEMEARAGSDMQAILVDAEHDIPEQAPQAIIDAIRDILEGAAG